MKKIKFPRANTPQETKQDAISQVKLYLVGSNLDGEVAIGKYNNLGNTKSILGINSEGTITIIDPETTSVSLELIDYFDYLTGHSTTSTGTIPVTKRLCIATLSSSQTLSVGDIKDGRELHIIVKAQADITITFPSSGFIKLTGDSLTVSNGEYAEINIISDGTNKYLRAV